MYIINDKVFNPFGKIKFTLSYSFVARSSWPTRWVGRWSALEFTTDTYDTALPPAQKGEDKPYPRIMFFTWELPCLS